MKIAVYSGSFNPLHIGHLAIMKYLSNDPEFDKTYLVVSPQSPFKTGNRQPGGEERYAAALQAVTRHPELNVMVDDIELKMEAPNYTIRTLDALRKREPENDFTLIIGADNLLNFSKWKDYKRILSEYGLVVFPREGYDMEAMKKELMSSEDSINFRIKLIDKENVDISSSEIRRWIESDKDIARFLM